LLACAQDFVYVMVKEWDIMFVLHHVAVLAILVTSMLTKAAGRICIFGLALGEATNVFQNSTPPPPRTHITLCRGRSLSG
jgi:hypothetical protein